MNMWSFLSEINDSKIDRNLHEFSLTVLNVSKLTSLENKQIIEFIKHFKSLRYFK